MKTREQKYLQEKLGERVRAARQKAGFSQVDMQGEGFSLSHYQKLERGVLDPRAIGTVLKLCEIFQVMPGELLDELVDSSTWQKSRKRG